MMNKEEIKQCERLKEENEKLKETVKILLKIQYALADSCNKYNKVLEEISKVLEVYFDDDNRAIREIEKIIDEVLK